MDCYFTKSLHKKALECPTKLFYQSKSSEYDNNNLDNEFLKALASGGFQVGELAKIYFPHGIEISARNSDAAIAETSVLLQQENVTLYEAAIAFGEFLVRVDVLVKKANVISIYEVKAKSIDPDEREFYDKRLLKKGVYKIKDSWQAYLYDIAFQTLVCRGRLSGNLVVPHFMLADKSSKSTGEGLNQRFFLNEEKDRTTVKVASRTDLATLGGKILVTIPVEEDVERILEGNDLGEKSRKQLGLPSFLDEAKGWAKAYLTGKKLNSALTKDCRGCEFRTHGDKKSGFDECWTPVLKKLPVKGEIVIDLWNFRKSGDLIAERRLFLNEVTQEDIKIEEPDSGMGVGQRQWLQVEKMTAGDMKPEIDLYYLRSSISKWKYPLHCIDFETTMVALPFNAGRRPYEQIAFQFSHHLISANGDVAHVGEYIHSAKGTFPNFDFVRALKKQLDQDEGSIFRYSNHENTVLCQIYDQLDVSHELDKSELMAFVKTITKRGKDGKDDEVWVGERNMIDLWDIVKKSYYHPLTYGSNSIKKVLPAVLFESGFLQDKYGRAVYGAVDGIKSLNFKDHQWLKRDGSGTIVDPYKQLPPVFEGIDTELLDSFISNSDELAEGGAAMTAFARMQFTEMTELETKALRNALLKYCELDTLAMVMIIEHFFEVTGVVRVKKVG